MTTDMVRFSAQHVTPTLAALAVRYVIAYTGDFEYLVNMKNRVAVMGSKSLNKYMIKGILNCMLVDPNVRNLPRPQAVIFDVEEEIREVRVTTRRRRVRASAFDLAEEGFNRHEIDEGWGDEEYVPRVNPYRRITLKSRWKFDYGISDHVKSCRVHIIDHSYPAVHWRPGGPEPSDTTTDWTNPFIELRLKWLCKAAHSMGHSPRYELMDFDAAWKLITTHDKWDWCGTCERIKER